MRIKSIIAAGALLCAAAVTSWGQVIDIHPASCPEGKRLSNDGPSPRIMLKRYSFAADGSLTDRPSLPKARKWKLPQSDANGISYGTSVSRNEFGIHNGIFPSPDSSRLAVYRKDESKVSEFPLLDIRTRTGSLVNIRYPMNGMPSEHVDLCICDTLGNILTTLKVTDFTDERYLTNISWTPDGESILVHVIDREQHHMHLNRYNAADGEFMGTLLTEENDSWIEPVDPVVFIDDRYFIYRTDNRDGYRNLYLCDLDGGILRLTAVDADVKFKAMRDSWLYYTSAEVSPVENHLFRMQVKLGKSLAKCKLGKPQRLTLERGWHDVTLNAECSQFIDRWSSLNLAAKSALRSTDGKLIKELGEAPDPLAGYAQCEVELGKVKSADGEFDNFYRFFKPLGFNPEKKYPLIVYVYGGPHSQMVKDTWLGGIRMWEMLMAQKGYAVYVQDNRGTENRGAKFEKAINRRCGQAEMEDQIAGLHELLERCPWIDRERIGVHGWSYGGFMTITLATNHPELFKTAVAGGPVIDWKWYEVMYGERYMDTPETNPEGFKETSLIEKAPQLKSKLLICQGAMDNTVVWQHSLNFVQECIAHGVQLDYFPYPLDEHNMTGKARFHLYNKITDYFETYL